jgi:hypothetical protein
MAQLLCAPSEPSVSGLCCMKTDMLLLCNTEKNTAGSHTYRAIFTSTPPILLNDNYYVHRAGPQYQGCVVWRPICCYCATQRRAQQEATNVKRFLPPRHPFTLMAQLLCTRGGPSVSELCCMKTDMLLLRNTERGTAGGHMWGTDVSQSTRGGGVTAARYFMRTDAKWAMREIIHWETTRAGSHCVSAVQGSLRGWVPPPPIQVTQVASHSCSIMLRSVGCIPLLQHHVKEREELSASPVTHILPSHGLHRSVTNLGATSKN